MSEKPNTISDADWEKLQRAAATKAGGLVKNAEQTKATKTWTEQRRKAGSS